MLTTLVNFEDPGLYHPRTGAFPAESVGLSPAADGKSLIQRANVPGRLSSRAAVPTGMRAGARAHPAEGFAGGSLRVRWFFDQNLLVKLAGSSLLIIALMAVAVVVAVRSLQTAVDDTEE